MADASRRPRPTRFRTMAFCVALVPFALLLPGCDSDPTDPADDDTVDEVEIFPDSHDLTAIEESVELNPIARNRSGWVIPTVPADYDWSSSQPSVVSVNAQGVATAEAEGTATVTAELDGRSGTATVTVDLAVAEVEVLPGGGTIGTVSATRQLSAVARTSQGGVVTDAPEDFEWTSSNPDVAVVDSGGLVTAVANGTATVAAGLDGVSGTAEIVVDAPRPGEFRDARLEAAVRDALERPTGELTAQDLEDLVSLEARQQEIEDLGGIEHAVNLVDLDVTGNEITGITPLGPLSGLEILSLTSNPVADLAPLGRLEGLQVLNAGGGALGSGRKVLAELPSLTNLTLTSSELTDVDFLVGAPALEFLNLGGNPEFSDISAVAQIPTLQRFAFSNTAVSDISALSELVELTSVVANPAPIEDLSPLEGLPQLRELFLQGLATADLSPLGSIASLERLSVLDSDITDLEPLATLTELRNLSLPVNLISDVSPLEGLTRLTLLHLGANEIRDVAPLVANEGLGSGTTVFLMQNPLSQTALCEQIPELEARGVQVNHDDSC